MKTIPFVKYHGNGNDFIIIDDRNAIFPSLHREVWVRDLCHRRFGIGADGLILIHEEPGYDFRMVYFNADGGEGSMCGNGGRCAVHFAAHLGLFTEKSHFIATDGPHEAVMESRDIVALHMIDVQEILKRGNDRILDTGSPHFVRLVGDVEHVDVFREGREIRNSPEFRKSGINVNFLSPKEGAWRIRTYERGVEDETMACGTGATASALALFLDTPMEEGAHEYRLISNGGEIRVRFQYGSVSGFTDIWLVGPVVRVFSGWLEV